MVRKFFQLVAELANLIIDSVDRLLNLAFQHFESQVDRFLQVPILLHVPPLVLVGCLQDCALHLCLHLNELGFKLRKVLICVIFHLSDNPILNKSLLDILIVLLRSHEIQEALLILLAFFFADIVLIDEVVIDHATHMDLHIV